MGGIGPNVVVADGAAGGKAGNSEREKAVFGLHGLLSEKQLVTIIPNSHTL